MDNSGPATCADAACNLPERLAQDLEASKNVFLAKALTSGCCIFPAPVEQHAVQMSAVAEDGPFGGAAKLQPTLDTIDGRSSCTMVDGNDVGNIGGLSNGALSYKPARDYSIESPTRDNRTSLDSADEDSRCSVNSMPSLVFAPTHHGRNMADTFPGRSSGEDAYTTFSLSPPASPEGRSRSRPASWSAPSSNFSMPRTRGDDGCDETITSLRPRPEIRSLQRSIVRSNGAARAIFRRPNPERPEMALAGLCDRMALPGSTATSALSAISMTARMITERPRVVDIGSPVVLGIPRWTSSPVVDHNSYSSPLVPSVPTSSRCVGAATPPPTEPEQVAWRMSSSSTAHCSESPSAEWHKQDCRKTIALTASDHVLRRVDYALPKRESYDQARPRQTVANPSLVQLLMDETLRPSVRPNCFVELPRGVFEQLRRCIQKAPCDSLVTSSSVFLIVREYSRKFKRGDNELSPGRSKHKYLCRMPWPLGRLVLEIGFRQSKTGEEDKEVEQDDRHEPIWQCLKSIFPSAEDLVCDMLYTHVLCLIYLGSYLPPAQDQSSKPIGDTMLRDDTREMNRKAANVLGLALTTTDAEPLLTMRHRAKHHSGDSFLSECRPASLSSGLSLFGNKTWSWKAKQAAATEMRCDLAQAIVALVGELQVDGGAWFVSDWEGRFGFGGRPSGDGGRGRVSLKREETVLLAVVTAVRLVERVT